MKAEIWNFWSRKYDKLWVQKYSLKPTREYIVSLISDLKRSENNDEMIKILDIGCGPGELIKELEDEFDHLDITGIDFSEGMLEVSMAKNPKTRHINMDVANLHKLKDKFNIIICTHSLPYYKDPNEVMNELNRLLEDGGKIYMGFASGDNFYDKFVLNFVKLTTGPANYPSDEKFKQFIKSHFQVENLQIIKEKFYMPRIAIYTLKKVSI